MGISKGYVCCHTGSPYTVGTKNKNTKLTETIHLNVTQTFTFKCSKATEKKVQKKTHFCLLSGTVPTVGSF